MNLTKKDYTNWNTVLIEFVLENMNHLKTYESQNAICK